MADEATIRQGIQIIVGGRRIYAPPTAAFKVDVSVATGPTPGRITALVTGTDVDLSALTTPGLCHIINYSTTDYLIWGIYDPETLRFYPVGEVAAEGEQVIELSRELAGEFTGTAEVSSTNRLQVRGGAGTVECAVNAFEK